MNYLDYGIWGREFIGLGDRICRVIVTIQIILDEIDTLLFYDGSQIHTKMNNVLMFNKLSEINCK